MDLLMGHMGDHNIVFPRKKSPAGIDLPNYQRIAFSEFMAGRGDPVRDKIEIYHDKFGDLMEKVMTPDDPYVDWQWTCGYDFFKDRFPKLTYYIASSFQDYVKFHYDGVTLWHFDPDMQTEMFLKQSVDDDLIATLQSKLGSGHTKHPLTSSETGVLPFDNYRLVVLQDYSGAREGDIFNGRDMLVKAIHWAQRDKIPTIIRPHPYVTKEIPESVFQRIRDGEWDYVRIAEDDFHPNYLVKNADSVVGTSSSLLIDAMVWQKDVIAYCNGDFAGVTNADIKQQNKWLSWFFNDRCINMCCSDVENEVRKRLDMSWSGKTWIKQKGKPKFFDVPKKI